MDEYRAYLGLGDVGCQEVLHRAFHNLVDVGQRLVEVLGLHEIDHVGAFLLAGLLIRLDEGEAVVITQNTVYHCSFESCLFDKQDKFPDAFDNYDSIREKYYTPSVTPEIEQGKVLLVLSSFDDYYFHSMYATTDDGMIEEYTHIPHIGMIQDSYLIFSKTGRIDLRYFPYMDGFISFYEVKTFGQPLYIENIGPGEIIVTESLLSGKMVDRLHLNPGERKEYPVKE